MLKPLLLVLNSTDLAAENNHPIAAALSPLVESFDQNGIFAAGIQNPLASRRELLREQNKIRALLYAI